MSDPVSELQALGRELQSFVRSAETADVANPLKVLEASAEEVGKSWSGSWMGYHAFIYYRDLQPPPAGANFSVEWGLMGISRLGSRGDWCQFSPDDVKRLIAGRAGNPDLKQAEKIAVTGSELFQSRSDQLLSILHMALTDRADPFLARLLEDTQKQELFTAPNFIRAWQPTGTMASRDADAVMQGLKVPPHLEVLSDIKSLQDPARGCSALARIALAAASHLERVARTKRRADRIGTNVFIGHGRSLVWRDLKDFISDRVRLPWDEFNRVPVAGVTNIARLSEMLDAAAIALIIMTAEDEQADGKLHARLNVVHEAGLFQGRLGFTKAILLVEDGCEEFSNVQGLGQIRFPKDNIKAVFEEIRRVLEREGLVES